MAPAPVEVRIERLSKLGEGVGVHEGHTVFVDGALPGERVRVSLAQDGKVLRGALEEVLERSPVRRDALRACAVSDRCGGCDWLHVDEEAQRQAKQEIVLSALEHLGRIPRGELEVLPLRASPRAMGYRRRAVMHFSGGRLAYFGRKSHEAVAIDRCPALVAPLEALPEALTRALAPMAKDAEEVHLLAEGERVAVAVLLKGAVKDKHREAGRAALRSAELAGLVLAPKEGSAELLGQPVLKGDAPLAPGVPLYTRPDAFAQANAEANEGLVAAAVELLAPREADRALELYCGNGNFTFALARRVAAVVAVESARTSLELARRSAREAHVSNARFVEGDSKKVAEGLAAEGQRFDVLLADPPRAGAKGIGGWASRLGARSVVYVACDPASLARDAAELKACGFTPRRLQVVDMFPQTRHVEAVMSFTRERA